MSQGRPKSRVYEEGKKGVPSLPKCLFSWHTPSVDDHYCEEYEGHPKPHKCSCGEEYDAKNRTT